MIEHKEIKQVESACNPMISLSCYTDSLLNVFISQYRIIYNHDNQIAVSNSRSSMTITTSEINYLLIYSRFTRYTSVPNKTAKIIAKIPAKPFISNK